MNEFYFLLQVLSILLLCYGAFRFGKEALIAAVSLQAILANLFVLKQIQFLGFEVTCSDAYAIGSIFCLNLLREFFGTESAKKAISICFFFMVFFVALSQIHLFFHPSLHDSAQQAYALLLKPAPRLLFASLITFFIVQNIDVRLFGWISKIMPRSPFPVRSSLSLTLSQLIDTILFSLLGLYGIVANIAHIVLISFLVKVCIIHLMAPLMILFKKVHKHV